MTVYRTTVSQSWAWMRLDILLRLVPLTLAPLVFGWFTGTPSTISATSVEWSDVKPRSTAFDAKPGP